MPLTIRKVGEKFTADADFRHAGIDWKTSVPMELNDLVSKLLELGVHQIDIGDALHNIDPRVVEP